MNASVVVDLALVGVAVVALWGGSRLFVDGAVDLARRLGLSELVIGLTVVAVGTSLPELVVTIDAALLGRGDLAVGNVIGSDIYNTAVILGVVTLVRSIPISRELVRRDGLVLLGTVALLLGITWDLRVSRLEGALLLALFVGYLLLLFRLAPGDSAASNATPDDRSDGSIEGPSAASPTPNPSNPSDGTSGGRGPLDVALLLVGLAVVVGGGHLLVGSAVSLARDAGVSEWIIGATVVAAGTSTPEFAVSLVALARGQTNVSVGNVIGSNVFNVLGVLGVAAAIAPLSVSPAAFDSALWLLGLVVLLVAALWSGRRLSRPEGGLLVGTEVIRWVLGFR
ncbi:calcium/sodium antiporter [Halegenticoccus tardaugens]|uniref:calcium/sodium antiporter n=1 Tax=Halegenticoccus tardaugens TaxID=2071624 RepID=UPI00100A32ED|nr:calcium/sodium antiporter [Halegenticoccus tardaugens]